jgi:RNA 2',3'-cyclic 3'-phosphodiesterase
MAKLRLFIALKTPGEAREKIARLRDVLRATGADVRWEPDEKLHCTLKFLGDTDERQLQTIWGGLQSVAAALPPFHVRYRSVGAFPSWRNPRVVWVGMADPEGILPPFQREIERALAAVGIPEEDRDFHPHVTIGRVRGQNLRNLITKAESITFETDSARIEEIHLVRSELKPGGSVYTVLNSLSLKP